MKTTSPLALSFVVTWTVTIAVLPLSRTSRSLTVLLRVPEVGMWVFLSWRYCSPWRSLSGLKLGTIESKLRPEDEPN